MLFANGDMCPGEKPRQTKVYFDVTRHISHNNIIVKDLMEKKQIYGYITSNSVIHNMIEIHKLATAHKMFLGNSDYLKLPATSTP